MFLNWASSAGRLAWACALGLLIWAGSLVLAGRARAVRLAGVLALPVMALGVQQGSGVFAVPLTAVYYWFCVALMAMARHQDLQITGFTGAAPRRGVAGTCGAVTVLVAHPTRQHSHRLAQALQDAGLLHSYWTLLPDRRALSWLPASA